MGKRQYHAIAPSLPDLPGRTRIGLYVRVMAIV